MNRRIQVPIVFAILSAAMNVIFVLGLVIGMVTGNGTLSLIKPTPTPTMTATATATATPTKTPTPTASPTRSPVKCVGGGVEGIDCPVTVFNLSVKVVGVDHPATYTEDGTEYRPKEGYEFFLVHLSLPSGTVRDEVSRWIVEDGGVHAPALVGPDGKMVTYTSAYADSTFENEYRVVIVFVIEKGSDPDLIFPDTGVTVDLSLVPDLTIATETVPATPAATDTSEVP